MGSRDGTARWQYQKWSPFANKSSKIPMTQPYVGIQASTERLQTYATPFGGLACM